MTAPTALDEAYERLASSGFDLPVGFVNHAPMACEALDALGLPAEVEVWARRLEGEGTPAVRPEPPGRDFDPSTALGEPRRVPEWMGLFERAIAEDGWAPVVATWVPPLLPGLATALYHGAIRTAHAVRAVAGADTPARRAELARSLGYWAGLCTPGEPADRAAVAGVEDPGGAVVAAAAVAARHYLARPGIFNLHDVTGAMAVALLAAHLPPDSARAGLAQVRAEHAARHRRTRPAAAVEVVGTGDDELARRAEASGDPHAVKLVEACRRGWRATGDPAFAAAAEQVVAR